VSKCGEHSGLESRVLAGPTKKGAMGAVIFASPYRYTDKTSGEERITEIGLKWLGEDYLQIYYSPAVFPRDPGHDFEHKGMKIRVVSTSIM
jgi:hypothetical protein